MIDRVDEAKRLAERARRYDASGDHARAVDRQRGAVVLLRAELTEQADGFPEEQRAAAHLLSDHLGRLGGLLRRAGRMGEAVAAYAEGAELETRYRLPDSYCATNAIVARILDDPARLPGLAPEIDATGRRVAAQVERERRDQWWAWADLGLLYLLAGRPGDAERAYRGFASTGARPTDYDSVLDVLRSLRDGLRQPAPDVAAQIDRTIDDLVSQRG